jgi:hypothetical protein
MSRDPKLLAAINGVDYVIDTSLKEGIVELIKKHASAYFSIVHTINSNIISIHTTLKDGERNIYLAKVVVDSAKLKVKASIAWSDNLRHEIDIYELGDVLEPKTFDLQIPDSFDQLGQWVKGLNNLRAVLA